MRQHPYAARTQGKWLWQRLLSHSGNTPFLPCITRKRHSIFIFPTEYLTQQILKLSFWLKWWALSSTLTFCLSLSLYYLFAVFSLDNNYQYTLSVIFSHFLSLSMFSSVSLPLLYWGCWAYLQCQACWHWLCCPFDLTPQQHSPLGSPLPHGPKLLQYTVAKNKHSLILSATTAAVTGYSKKLTHWIPNHYVSVSITARVRIGLPDVNVITHQCPHAYRSPKNLRSRTNCSLSVVKIL